MRGFGFGGRPVPIKIQSGVSRPGPRHALRAAPAGSPRQNRTERSNM